MRLKQLPIQIFVCVAISAALLVTNALGADKEGASDKEQKLNKKDLPVAVLTAFEKSYPKAVIRYIGKETDSSATRYEIESTEGKAKRTLSYLADGSVAEIEEIISPKDMPLLAQQSVTRDHPNGKVKKVEKATRMNVVTYEALIVSGGKRIEIIFDSTGTPLSTKEEAAEEDKD